MNMGPLVGWVAVAVSILGIAGGGMAKFSSAETDIEHLQNGSHSQGILLAQITNKQAQQEGTIRVIERDLGEIKGDINRIDKTIQEDRAASREDRQEFIRAVDRLTEQLKAEEKRR